MSSTGKRLFLIVGNSGSGKDSILETAVQSWELEKPRIIVARRHVTRPASPDTEDFIPVTLDQFKELDASGEFFLKWLSYGMWYGVGRDVLAELDAGNIVIVNVSRQIIDETRKRFPDMKVIFVWVPLDLTIQRIKDRGRENDEQIKIRVARARQMQELPGADYVVKNIGTLDEAATDLIAYLKRVA